MFEPDFSGVIREINTFLQRELWFDFEIMEYKNSRLMLFGSVDATYRHDIEIYFHDVFFVSAPMEWQTDTSTPPLELVKGEEADRLNINFQVEHGFYIFRFNPEYYPREFGCFIAAKEIKYKLP